MIVRAMDQHELVSYIQESACRALSNLAVNDENSKKMGEAGGIGMILRAMEHHQRVHKVQEEACRTLISLTDNNENR